MSKFSFDNVKASALAGLLGHYRVEARNRHFPHWGSIAQPGLNLCIKSLNLFIKSPNLFIESPNLCIKSPNLFIESLNSLIESLNLCIKSLNLVIESFEQAQHVSTHGVDQRVPH